MRSGLLTVTSPVSPIRVEPFTMHVQYAEYKHDVLTFTAPKGSTATSTPFVSGLPIRAQWAHGPSSRGVFYGYIDRVEGQHKQVGAALMQSQVSIRCVGTTFPMKSEDYTTYTDMTADQALQEIAKGFYLASYVEPHDVVWPSLSQSGKSWWTFAIEVAKRVGYSLYVQDTTLFAVDRRTALHNAQTFTYNLVQRPQGVNDVLHFEPCASSGSGVDEDAPGSFIVRGQSMFSGENFECQSEDRTYTGNTQAYVPLFQRVLTDTPRTLAEAQAYLNAAVAKSMFTQRAVMKVLGNTGLGVGSVIFLNAPYDQIHAGSWYVTSVEHRILLDRYETTVEMGKDASGYPYPFPPQTAEFTQYKTIPGVVFRNDTWTAAWSTS